MSNTHTARLRPPVRKRQTGFTIVELVVTIVIIGILIPTVTSFLNTINALNARANILSTVNAYAENRVETFRSVGFKSIPLTTTPVAFSGSEALPAAVPSPNSATYQVTLLDPAVPTVKKIVITVSFKTINGNEIRHYTTYIGELGVGQY